MTENPEVTIQDEIDKYVHKYIEATKEYQSCPTPINQRYLNKLREKIKDLIEKAKEFHGYPIAQISN